MARRPGRFTSWEGTQSRGNGAPPGPVTSRAWVSGLSRQTSAVADGRPGGALVGGDHGRRLARLVEAGHAHRPVVQHDQAQHLEQGRDLQPLEAVRVVQVAGPEVRRVVEARLAGPARGPQHQPGLVRAEQHGRLDEVDVGARVSGLRRRRGRHVEGRPGAPLQGRQGALTGAHTEDEHHQVEHDQRRQEGGPPPAHHLLRLPLFARAAFLRAPGRAEEEGASSPYVLV